MKLQELKNLLFVSAAFFLVASCATTSNTASSAEEADNTIITDITEEIEQDTSSGSKVRKEPKPISVQNTSNQQETEFKELLKKIDIKVVSSPKTTMVDKAFSVPYIINVSDENGGIADLDITVTWPVGRSNNTLTYSSTQIKTDVSGNAIFSAAVPKFAVKDVVTFYPSPVSSSSNIVKAAYEAAVTAQYAVKSNYINYPGGVLYVYDFNEKGKAGSNNFTMLQTLRNSGVNVGNSPISDTSYFEKPVYDLYKATYDIVGKAYKFMVIGSFKYAEPSRETEEGTTVKVTEDITCVDMNNGNVIYKTIFSESVTDKNKWNAEQKCRKILAEKAADAIVYGM